MIQDLASLFLPVDISDLGEREKKNRETFGRTRFLGVQAMIYIRFTVS